MKLKGLELQGFKTFPDKTKLNFTNGITAVVGPNGSGKSNISDAIRWVLGEQSAKALRCSKMEDVIFNGTQQRKKTGYAQVTLSIDNADRSLPFDGDEVAVTRRFYRSGNSEYLLNNTAVRLQDIHELFMDTGLGRDGYSMIGQGKIDAIVSTKSEDRREIFEEAAGISRFRYKKADAEKRLDKTEENLVRLRDILSELEGRVEPLRVQSEKAKAYLSYAEEKRGLEIALWLKTLDKSSLQIREQEDNITVTQSQYDAVEQSLQGIQQESETIFSRQNELAAQADEMHRQAAAYETQAAETTARVSVLNNDLLHHEGTVERIRADIALMRQSGEAITAEIADRQQTLEEYRDRLQKKQAELTRYTRQLDSLKTDENRSSQQLEEINRVLSELAEKSADAKIRYMTASSSIEALTARMENVENTVKARTSQKATLQQILTDYAAMLSDCKTNMAELSEEIEKHETVMEKQRRECDRLKISADRLSLDSEQLFRKAKMLEELENNLEGFAQSVKIVMREAKKGNLTGLKGPVSRVIQTPPQYSTAIEIALGAAMQNIVTTDEEAAKRAIAYLKQCRGGRATFLPMSVMKGRELHETGLEQCEGFIGIAAALCTCEPCYREILFNLLGKIVVARDIDCATAIAGKYGYRFRVVTLDGQVVNAGGSLTGGSLSKNTGLLGRASEIQTIRAEAQKIADTARETQEQYQEKQQELSELSASWEGLKQELAVLNEDKIKIEAESNSRQTELDNTRKALEEILREQKESSDKLEALNDSMNHAREAYESYTQQSQKQEERASILSGSKNEYLQMREELTDKLQEIRLAVVTLQKDMDSANADIQNALLRGADADEKIRSDQKEIDDILSQNTAVRAEIKSLEEQAKQLADNALQCNGKLEQLSKEKMQLEQRSAKLRQEEREQTAQKANLQGELARLEERRRNLQKQYDEILSKLWEEYELTKREAEDIAVKIEEVGKAQRRLNELKQKIRSLGNVNVSAIEEYKEVSERYRFLKVQIGDVEKSKAELLKLINELTKQMREIFVERFQLINQRFSATFIELFGGGKASLSLSDPENVLTTGIDISVEPPGKIVSHIELLSGGEKALVAIALYFAIMKVSPAPFCVMDEIEAALDDVNVYRFAAYLRRMNDNTQFICITHRRGTMEEADVLYGVTMQDRGISKLLELRASEVEQKLGIK